MPAFLLPAIAGALLSIAASLVGRVIIALGMGLVTYTGLNAAFAFFRTTFDGAIGSGGAVLLGMMGTLQIDTCLSIFTAAALAKLAIAGATSGTIKKLAFK